MAAIIQGRIVYPRMPIPDPQGQNPKAGRPFIVLTRNEEIVANGRIQLVGITSNLTQSPQDHYVKLKWGPHARTTLREESGALCTWLIDVSVNDVEIGRGYVDRQYVEQILSKVQLLFGSGQQPGDTS